MNKFNKEQFMFSKEKGVWHDGKMHPPETLIFKDRMVHAEYGVDTYGMDWCASTPNNWNCKGDLTPDEAYLWVLDGKGDPDTWFEKHEH